VELGKCYSMKRQSEEGGRKQKWGIIRKSSETCRRCETTRRSRHCQVQQQRKYLFKKESRKIIQLIVLTLESIINLVHKEESVMGELERGRERPQERFGKRHRKNETCWIGLLSAHKNQSSVARVRLSRVTKREGRRL
jgi:hypothetical protein